MLYAIVAVLAIIVDQWVKYWASSSIFDHSMGETFIPGILSLVNVHNDGAAFSLLAGGGARIYFIVLTGVFTVAVIIALATNFISGKLARWSIVMVTAGGLSNCIDRVIYGYVEDMFKCELFNFPVFNVADIFITVFAILFVIAVIFGKNPEKDEEDVYLEDDEEDERALRKQRAAARKAEKQAARAAKSEEEAPAKPARKSRKAREEQDDYEAYEEYKAARAQRQKAAARRSAEEPAPEAPVRKKAAKKAAEEDEAFAEWDRANARAGQEARRSTRSAAAARSEAEPAKPARTQRAPRPAAPAEKPSVPAEKPAAPAEKPAAPVQQRPARKAEPVSKPVDTSDDFSLDDILAEFK